MVFQLTWERRPNAVSLDDRVAVLRSGTGDRAEVWPALGFNAYRWHVAGHELLYASPSLFEENRPTRSGFPTLFPFPNRIRGGAFSWDGTTYRLPTIDPAAKNAIHGFAVRGPWRVVDEGADAEGAWLTGEFQGSRDDPASLALWPTDYRLRVTYRLKYGALRIEAVADNPGDRPLPFGLGYHPYFAVEPFGGEDAEIMVPAQRYWELQENLPTGARPAVEGARDLRQGRRMKELALDDVLTDLRQERGLLGGIRHPTGRPALSLYGSADFREMVVFTPPHRQAICLEPYTCTTDAINLQRAGVDAGLRVLAPGERWSGDVELVVENVQHQPRVV